MLTLLSGNFSRSLYRLRLKFVQTTRVVSRKYYVLTNLSTCTHHRKCVHSLTYLRVLTNVFTRIFCCTKDCVLVSKNLPTLDVLEWGEFCLGKLGVCLLIKAH